MNKQEVKESAVNLSLEFLVFILILVALLVGAGVAKANEVPKLCDGQVIEESEPCVTMVYLPIVASRPVETFDVTWVVSNVSEEEVPFWFTVKLCNNQGTVCTIEEYTTLTGRMSKTVNVKLGEELTILIPDTIGQFRCQTFWNEQIIDDSETGNFGHLDITACGFMFE